MFERKSVRVQPQAAPSSSASSKRTAGQNTLSTSSRKSASGSPAKGDFLGTDEGYESEGNLSIAASFTRTTAALNLGFDSDFDDNESLPDLTPAKPIQGLQGGQTVAESWDDDFIFTSAGEGNAESSKTSGPSKDRSNLTRDNFSEEEEISNWDSEGSEVPNSGQENDSQSQSSKQALSNRAKNSDNSTHDKKTQDIPSKQGHSAALQSSSQPRQYEISSQPTTPTSKKRWPLSKQSHKDAVKVAVPTVASQSVLLALSSDRPLGDTNRGKSPETPKHQAKATRKQSTAAQTNDVQTGGDHDSSISKRKSFGLGEKTWSKLLQSKLQRKKEQSAQNASYDQKPSEMKASTQIERPSLVQDSQKASIPSRKIVEPSYKTFPTITENSTIRANETLKTSNRVPERPPVRQAQSRPSLSGTFEQSNKVSSNTAQRSPAKEEYWYGSISEHRQWASRLNKESPPRRGTVRKKDEGSNHTSINSMPFSEQLEEKRIGKRKMDIEEKNSSHGIVNGNSPKSLDRPTRAMPSESTRKDSSRPGVYQNRSASDSTTISVTSSIDYDKSSMAGSNLTDTSTDSSVAISSPLVTQSHTPKIQIIRQLPSDVESLPSSTDSKLSRTRRPPPVSSGIGSLTRRQAAMQLQEMSLHDRSASRQEWLDDDDDLNGSDSRSVSSRKSDGDTSVKSSKAGDLKIPSRISKAQEGVRADMMRIRNFATGIEELKGLRDAYHRILDRLDDHAEIEKTAAMKVETLRLELEHSEYVYGSWWECAEVLIGLADGKNELENASEERQSETKGEVNSLDQVISNDRFSTVRRSNNEKAKSVTNSRASSSASRYVHPERERDILAAMLAGTPPEQASPSRSSVMLPRNRTTSVDTPSSRDPHLEGRTIRDNRRMSSQSVIVQSRRRTSDPDPGKEKGKEAGLDVQQHLPFNPAQNTSKAQLDHLKNNNRVMRQTSGGRRHLRSAGQQGLQGLKDLIVTIRRNSTTMNYRDEARTSQVSLRGSFGESSSEISGGRKTPSGRIVNPLLGSGTGTESPAKPPYLNNLEANTSSTSLQRPNTRIPKSSGSYDADGEKSAADTRPSRRFIRFARASSSSSAFSLDGNGQESSIDSTWTEAELSTTNLGDIYSYNNSHIFDAQPSKTISQAHRRTISMLSRALPIATRKNDRFTGWNGFSSSNNLPLASHSNHLENDSVFGNLRNNRSEAHLTSTTSIPPFPRTMSEEGRLKSPGAFEESGGKSNESDWTLHEAPSSAAANRMRVMSADHLDLAAQKQAEEASEAFRKLAMRSEAMPSLNRYLDTTKARCRESLTMLKDLEGQIRR
ncbi:hypothetical protein L7F22_043797 [Adiantum nelumboides]|nr:hypothetical protein [Adiantum nelumboides]